MVNTQVRDELIHHAVGHYLAVAGYRYMVKTRKRGIDAELIYWKCTEKNCTRHRKHQTKDNLVTRCPKNHNHPPAP